jgi:predicted RND superfamily exporter protein
MKPGMTVLAVVTLVLVCGASLSAAFTITIDANKEECFFETVSQGDSIGIMYQVVSGGFLDIDLLVRTDPTHLLDAAWDSSPT